ncbi:MAG: hypothetical protein M1818_004095 [Claussenomyces sp. TS43310]|nr:MAG: hypothetical protein M1818_004095 [Claussenomyces sp. TS43310]
MSGDGDIATNQDLAENRQDSLRASNISVVILATVFVGLRFFARWKAAICWGLDDYFLLLALGILFALLALGLECEESAHLQPPVQANMHQVIHNGVGKACHTYLHHENLTDGIQYLLAFECVYVTTVAIIKISLLLMYRRAFDIRSLRIQAWILGAIVVAWAIAIVCVCIFQCDPVPKAWSPWLDGHCIDLKGSFIGNAVPNIVTDVLILALPVRYVWKLVPNLALRLQLTCVFLLGSLVIAASCYRFTTLFLFQPTDTPWTLATACAWCVVECSVGVVSVCLPTLGPLLQFASCTSRPSHRSRSQSRSARSKGPKSSTGGTATTGTREITYRRRPGADELNAVVSERSVELRQSAVSSDLELGTMEHPLRETPVNEAEDIRDKWHSEHGHGEMILSGLTPRDMSGRDAHMKRPAVDA